MSKELKSVDHIEMCYFKDFPVRKLCFREKIYQSILNMVPLKGDVFLSTYPRCGTTWTQYMIWEILHDGQVPPDTNQMMFKEFPFLEVTGIGLGDNIKSPRPFKLHLPFRLTPFSEQAKYIYVMRNPFDCCVSLFYHFNETDLRTYGQKISFDAFFDDFMSGNIPWGCYFEHVQSWYQKRNQPNVLFMSFEDAKEDQEKTLLMIAHFLGPQYKYKLEENPHIMANVMKYSSFSYMKKNLTFRLPKTPSIFRQLQDNFLNGGSNMDKIKDDNWFRDAKFYRHGMVGTSKAELSDEQWGEIDRAIDTKIHDIELRKMMRKTKPTLISP